MYISAKNEWAGHSEANTAAREVGESRVTPSVLPPIVDQLYDNVPTLKRRIRLPCLAKGSVCCFVLLNRRGMLYRVPRVSPGVTAPKLFSPSSVAGYAGPSSS